MVACRFSTSYVHPIRKSFIIPGISVYSYSSLDPMAILRQSINSFQVKNKEYVAACSASNQTDERPNLLLQRKAISKPKVNSVWFRLARKWNKKRSWAFTGICLKYTGVWALAITKAQFRWYNKVKCYFWTDLRYRKVPLSKDQI